jgi:hypothetical protein
MAATLTNPCAQQMLSPLAHTPQLPPYLISLWYIMLLGRASKSDAAELSAESIQCPVDASQ